MSVILPGSYDPVTVGHLEIIKRAAREYDEVYVVIFTNPNKKYRFSLEDRVAMLMLATEGLDNVLVSYSNGLVIDYMREHGIEKIIKGYRTEADLPWEHEQAEWNKKHGGYETELWKCSADMESISSTAVRAALDRGESIEALVPEAVAEYIRRISEKH
ncbi:MAG: pantetheine-phosphate adenylyltransferase [Clostridia bacterium]|nr:pantetheine-phosphate adenylyltransferase [Clostridia bacterium]